MSRFRFSLRAVAMMPLLAAGLTGLCAAGGLDPESNTDGYDPAAQSYRINEARRLNAISRQLDLNYQMQWENPYFPGEGPIRQPIGYESKQVGDNRWIYRPIYSEDVAPSAELPPPSEVLPVPNEALPLPLPADPPLTQQQRPAPADAVPGDFMPPQKKPAGRPREF